MSGIHRLRFGAHGTAPAVQAGETDELPAALHALGLIPPRPVLVLVGGANGLATGPARALDRLFEGLSAGLFQDLDLAVLDGGTDAGAMALMGRARARRGGAFPLLGIAARGTVQKPGAPPGDRKRARLEPNHSHFLLVPGDDWGDESPWITAAAKALAGGARLLTLVAGGGRVTRRDLDESLAAGLPTFVLAGSGGTADEVARAMARGEPPLPGIAPEQARLLQSVELASAEQSLPPLLRAVFAG